MTERLLIVGAGGHGRSVLEAIRLAARHDVVGFIDDSAQAASSVWGVPLAGTSADLPRLLEMADNIFIAVGNNAARQHLTEIAMRLGYKLPKVVHPAAFVSPSATLEDGCAIMARATVNTEAHLCRGSIVNCGAVVDHHARVGEFGHLGVNACMAGGTQLGKGAWMQAGSCIGYGVHLPGGVVLAPGQGVSEWATPA